MYVPLFKVKNKGFSLLELVFVMTIMGVLVVVAAPRWPGHLFLQAQAQQLAQDIRYTQALAMNLKDGASSIRSENGNLYTILDQYGNVRYSASLALEGVVLSPFSVSFSSPMGEANQGDTTIRLSLGEAYLDVIVVALTGAVVFSP